MHKTKSMQTTPYRRCGCKYARPRAGMAKSRSMRERWDSRLVNSCCRAKLAAIQGVRSAPGFLQTAETSLRTPITTRHFNPWRPTAGGTPLASVRTMQEVYDKSVARTSFTLVMLGIAGAMALALGIIGIYGVMSYTVSQRRREIGVRLALGAQGGDVVQMVLRQGTKLVLLGVAIGIGAAFGLTRLMANLLFGVTAHDPLTFIAVAALLMLIALLACYIPARRAMLVDPIVALRYE